MDTEKDGRVGQKNKGVRVGGWIHGPHQPEISCWDATARAHVHIRMHSVSETKVSSFLLSLHGKHCSHYHPAQVTSHPVSLSS